MLETISSGFMETITVLGLYLSGIATVPLVRLGGKTISAFGHLSSILVFLKTYPMIAKILYGVFVLTFIVILLTTSGCARHHAITVDEDGVLTHGPFAELCWEENTRKSHSLRTLNGCVGTNVLGQVRLNSADSLCPDEANELRSSMEEYKECMEREKAGSFNLNVSQGSSSLNR